VSAISAREEIGRAMADKIRELSSARDLKKIAEDVLPRMEKFLESPAEKRLRRIRNGFMVSAVGLGAALGFFALAAATKDPEIVFFAALGVITFLIGIATIVNGYAHTVPKGDKPLDRSKEPMASALGGTTSDLKLPEASEPVRPFRSVTEGTTTHLADKQPIPRS